MQKLHVWYQDRGPDGVSVCVATDENEAREVMQRDSEFYDHNFAITCIAQRYPGIVVDNRGGNISV